MREVLNRRSAAGAPVVGTKTEATGASSPKTPRARARVVRPPPALATSVRSRESSGPEEERLVQCRKKGAEAEAPKKVGEWNFLLFILLRCFSMSLFKLLLLLLPLLVVAGVCCSCFSCFVAAATNYSASTCAFAIVGSAGFRLQLQGEGVERTSSPVQGRGRVRKGTAAKKARWQRRVQEGGGGIKGEREGGGFQGERKGGGFQGASSLEGPPSSHHSSLCQRGSGLSWQVRRKRQKLPQHPSGL